MGNFEGKYWKIYLDSDAQERRDEILDHLKQNYSGPSGFVQEALFDEEALSIDERIKRLEQDKKEVDSDLEKLKQIKREREQQDKLRDKKELLKEKQKKLRKIRRSSSLSERDALYRSALKVYNNCKEKASRPSNSHLTPLDLFRKESYQRRVSHYKNKKLERGQNVDELVEDVQRLQKQVAELNSGREDWFLDLDTKEVSA